MPTLLAVLALGVGVLLPGAGMFRLWFPVLTALVAARVLLTLVPSLFGTPLGRLRLFSPDLVLALVATAVTGVVWAAFRVAVSYFPVPGVSRPVS